MAALLVPAFGSRFYTFLANDVIIWALFATSLNLLVGYTGLVSFGHAAYFGVGAYATGILMKKLALPFLLALAGGRDLGAACALVFGFFCVRLTRIYFAMLTLAFAQIVWAICFKWNELTGGEQGMPEIPYPDFGWLERVGASVPLLSWRTAEYFYFLTVVLVAASLWALHRIVHSPFGRMLTTIRENAERAEFIGVNVRAVRARRVRAGRRVRRARRRALRHLQPRRVPGFRVLDEVVRGADHDACSAAWGHSSARASARSS